MKSCDFRFYDEGSDIWFGDFNETDYFRIEEAEHYIQVLKHNSIKAVDCILCQHNESGTRIMFIEAKKNLHFTGKGIQNKISNIAKQFIDSLHILCGAWLGGDDAKISLPSGITQYCKQSGKIVFTLVVKNCPVDVLFLIVEDLNEKLKREMLIWNFEIRVYNEELAVKKNIVVPTESYR